MKTTPDLNPILIIDDEPPILDLLSESLTRNGYDVDTVESGEKGIKKIESNNYSLIFTDIKMPGLSGEQVLQYLKHIQNSLTPIVGMSGTPWLLDQSDFDAVLPKPFSMKRLLKVVRQFIN
ncbi:MAG: response regulator [Desulfobacula sp.]|uniref:response regulator n=1 Tax=Desulfobacula sp. TaxID=2593537 RepID=UPI0025BE2182|nr:response regulator [Desulfobacula sp.]MCD4718410.1 response regulator [Desulfobacula sp.]